MCGIKLFMALPVLFILAAISACGENSAEPMQPQPAIPAQPAPTLAPAPTVPRMTPNTPSPAEIPARMSTRASIPVPTPAPAQTPALAPMAVPTPVTAQTPTPEPVSTDSGAESMMTDLPPGCLTDGSLDDAALIVECSGESMRALKSVVMEATINLAGLFMGAPPPGAGPVESIEMELTRVFPDQVSVVLKIPEGGEVMMIVTGGAGYINDPMSNGWVKVSELPAEMSEMFLTLSSIEEQTQNTSNPNINWNEVALSDDRSKYLVSFGLADDSGAPLMPISLETQVVMSANNFLHESVALVAEDADGVGHKIIDLQYSRHNDPLIIEAPSEYTEASGMTGPVAPGPPEVTGLARNDEGDVEVKFSEVVAVSGDVNLYVVDPATGGWELPIMEGSGTDTLIFMAAPDGKPSLIPGESLIAGFIFETSESKILDSEGNFVNPVFEDWVYPE